MALSQEIKERSVAGFFTTLDATEQVCPLSLDGAPAADTVPIAADEQWEISDLIICVLDVLRFRLQQSNDNGVTWFDVWVGRFEGTGMTHQLVRKSPVRVNGVGTGASQVLLRLLVTTTAGATLVTPSLGCASQKNGAIVNP